MFINCLEELIERGKYVTPSNTLKEPLINHIGILKELNEKLTKLFNIIDNINHYLLHPRNIWIGLFTISYPVAVCIGSIGIILWASGWKKGLKLSGWTLMGYAIVNIIGV
ncbi:hypothetical protein [Clostridium novyi]|uniref:Uncharacterized protein n=1 Tax=Clostridium novyi B str. ATCC 27606 TaxID=1443123 RepID=A0AA40IRK7_CLONO|nr:hypothetical protein [Clostridium novyi]KEI08191.1 hypothetical protein Z958_p0073 [Clostridium novyi B str. NCTC 9691]KEI11458.1 hypothetical protein Z959_p0021 [Clostridium novyi B str. ATCC 27606]